MVIWCRVRVNKNKDSHNLCAIRPLNIYHLAAAVTYVWCFWCISNSFRVFFFVVFFLFLFFWCCISSLKFFVSLVQHVIIMWHNHKIISDRYACFLFCFVRCCMLRPALLQWKCHFYFLSFAFVSFPCNSSGFIGSSSKCEAISNLLYSASS